MARAKTTKKAATRITKKVEARIVELSLKNPDLGAKRLIPLLKQKKIDVSSSQIYSVLKRHDLQTREKRLTRAEKKAPQKAKSKAAKPTTKMTDETEEQIVSVSLQNPDFGARRLVFLLKDEDIAVSTSAVYSVLKRHGLQNRSARLKRLKDEAVKPAAVREAPAADITPEAEDHIAEIALQNPDFGAKRLLPLLQESGIDVSSGKVYSILKARGLQSRELRRARLEELQRAEDTSLTEEVPVTEVTPEIEKRIVEASLQNPDYGAQRLTGLLANEGIAISSAAVYSLLKRHGLQTLDLRQSRIELERLTEEDSSAEEPEVPDAVLVPTAPEEPEPAATDTDHIPARHPVAPAAAVAVKSHRGARWLFYLADVLLLVLLGYLGFLGYHAVVNFQQARSQPKAVAMVKPEPVRRAEQPQIAVEPLDGYRKIWERNLFNIPDKTAPAPKPEVPIENIALAKKSIGLKLVGTVVANDANYSRAIVHVTKTREQDAYRVGDQAGKAKIKKILRNKVIITTDKGDQLLTIDDEDFGKGGRASPTAQARTAGGLASPQISAGSTGFDTSAMPLNRRRVRSINIKQEVVAASLADTNQLLEELSITPFMKDDQPAGFIISKIPRGSVLTRMGLRNGYVVTQINDTAITGPEQAADFFRTLAEGGEVTIQVQRSRGVRRRPREINLNIE